MAEPLTEPWTLARDRYLESLEPDERPLFTEATIENLFHKTSNIQRADRISSKTRNAAEKLQPLVNKIEGFGKALDTFTSIAPLLVAPIWGSLRVVLVVAQKFTKFYEKIIDTLGRIGDILPRLLVSFCVTCDILHMLTSSSGLQDDLL